MGPRAALYLVLAVPSIILMFAQPRLTATLNSLEADRRYRRLALADVHEQRSRPVGFLLPSSRCPDLPRRRDPARAQGFAIGSVVVFFRRGARGEPGSRREDPGSFSAPSAARSASADGRFITLLQLVPAGFSRPPIAT